MLVNCTEYDINLVLPDGKTKFLSAASKTPEVVDETAVVEEDDVPIKEVTRRYVANLPEPREGVKYIVSKPMIKFMTDDRDDVVILPFESLEKDGSITCDHLML